MEAAVNDNAPEVLTAEEAAAFLRLQLNTVYDFAGRGAIPHRRVGKRLLFSRSALVAWLGGACWKGTSIGA